MNYQIFDTSVASDTPFQGLQPSTANPPEITVSLAARTAHGFDWEWFHTWLDSGGDVAINCARAIGGADRSEYLLRFPALADFLVDEMQVQLLAGSTENTNTLNHLLLDQVLPRVWAHSGRLVLHGATVQMQDGRVLVIVGDSGHGKSTLSAYLGLNGARLLGDDCVELRLLERGVQVIPSYPGLRLNTDSIEHLQLDGKSWQPMAHYSDKQRCQSPGLIRDVPLLLHGLYLLDTPGSSSVIRADSIPGAEAVSEVIRNTFVLDITDRRCAAEQLALVAAVLRSGPRIARLNFPRNYASLPDVHACLMQDGGQ